MAHIAEIITFTAIAVEAGAIAFWGNDPLRIKDDCALARPTLFLGTTRLMEVVYDKVNTQLSQAEGFTKCIISKFSIDR